MVELNHRTNHTEKETVMTNEMIDAIERVLKGETVNGIKVGDAGITEEWCKTTLANLKGMK